MMSVLSVLSVGLMLVTAFCRSTPAVLPADYPYAVARRGCTQEDAPALEIYLTKERWDGRGEPASPFVRFEVAWTDWAQISDSSLALVPLSRQGIDRRQHVVRGELKLAEGKSSSWLTGRIVLKRVEMNRRAEGSYDLVGPDKGSLLGSFNAVWIESSGGCG
jgi:hypothetical protein